MGAESFIIMQMLQDEHQEKVAQSIDEEAEKKRSAEKAEGAEKVDK